MKKMQPIISRPEVVIDVDKLTPLAAIGLKCWDCAGGSRREVRTCHIDDCALHPFRLRGLKNMSRCMVEGKRKGGKNTEGLERARKRRCEQEAQEDQSDDDEAAAVAVQKV